MEAAKTAEQEGVAVEENTGENISDDVLQDINIAQTSEDLNAPETLENSSTEDKAEASSEKSEVAEELAAEKDAAEVGDNKEVKEEKKPSNRKNPQTTNKPKADITPAKPKRPKKIDVVDESKVGIGSIRFTDGSQLPYDTMFVANTGRKRPANLKSKAEISNGTEQPHSNTAKDGAKKAEDGSGEGKE